ncbi:hypothetical protein [Streptomyces spectabilis]|uniref:Uncharacterized protein n=1 Tax=Streptomyces spectabilis TaxID=68270 RepID=A0A5P2XE70_STRST|nr:hypothetical protein [Streptomyces spectabilis]MBB5108126.1 hypothetical protein [Streptomyces spectabilis]MCI3904349.1 hypothetical protein [Streptomyces spectabilis]QEV61455.1 hypothetical protein CP982_24395 [Streptomyces spectabilis]GGV26680.1 hypothetical protein GCM10010245_43810 [Streptomyces spectabilis]
MGNLWIGPPGAMYEIDQAAKSFDRSADLGVSEFKSLTGRITLTRHPAPIRRVKLSWDLLGPHHARALDRLARRVDGAGPLVLVDPGSVNVLGPAQAAGRGPSGAAGLQQWSRVSANGSVIETSAATGVFSFTADDATSRVAWRWPGPGGNFPVTAGLPVSFHAPTALAVPASRTVGIDFKRADGTTVGSATANGPLVTATVPDQAAYLTPHVRPGTAGTFALAGACLTYGGERAADGVPGDGLPLMSVTGYSDAPARPLPYRSFGIDLVEVTGATG